MQVRFEAPDYRSDGGFEVARYGFRGDPEVGWRIERNGEPHLELGPGYRPLQSLACGVCATDLARRFLPFPLPQVIGHEVLAVDDQGRRQVVEINASCRARGLSEPCAFCSVGLEHHCPERRVLGIHDLPGGFGPWVLAPVRAVLPVPERLASDTAALIEPFAAALHAVTEVAPQAGDRVAVLGTRRLGLLLVAALASWRVRERHPLHLIAMARRPSLLERARQLGADEVIQVEGDGADLPSGSADVVIDTTGSPEGLVLAIRLARREVHLKSTHGRPAVGLGNPTALVVDELCIERLPESGACDLAQDARVAWLAGSEHDPAWAERVELRGGRSAATILAELESETGSRLPRADAAVIDGVGALDDAVRPSPTREVGLVRPGGRLWVHPRAEVGSSPLLSAVVERGLRLTTSRCGEFGPALALLAQEPALRDLGQRMITHRLPAGRLAEAFATAAEPNCVKVLVEHEAG